MTEPVAPAVRPPSRGARLGVALGWFLVALAAFGVLLHALPMTWQPLIVAASFARLLMWPVLLGLALLLVNRRWVASGIAGVVLVAAAATQTPLYVGSSGGEADLQVLQLNVHHDGADPASVVHAVESRGIDVALTEEVSEAGRAAFIHAGLSRLLPYRVDAGDDAYNGVSIWSRFPLHDAVRYDQIRLGAASATLTVGGRRLTVALAHPTGPYPLDSSRWLTEMSRLRVISRQLIADSAPVILGGDFNATPDMAQFRALLTDYRDAGEATGAGYVATYPSNKPWPPLVGIDHVLTAACRATSLVSITIPGTDHRGLVAGVRL